MRTKSEKCDVLVGFSPVGCIPIRITATLGYEYRLFATLVYHVDNLTNLMSLM
jgi:hypothetical protein